MSSPQLLAEATAAVNEAKVADQTPFLLLLLGPPMVVADCKAADVVWIGEADQEGGTAVITNILRKVAHTVTTDKQSAVLSSSAATMDGRVRAVCEHIAKVAGVRFLVHVLAPERWLTCDAGTRGSIAMAATAAATTDVAGAAAAEDGAGDGTGGQRWRAAMDTAATEFEREHALLPSLTPQEWAARTHEPLVYEQGVSVTTTPAYHPGQARPGALAYRDLDLEAATAAALAGERFLVHEGAVGAKATCAQLYREIRRGVGEAHLTLMSPQELTAHLEAEQPLKQDDFIATVAAESKAEVHGIVQVGTGLVVREDGNWTMFLVYDWPWAQEWRARFGLGPKDLHITLGFSDQDVFKKADGKTQVAKDKTSCAW